MLTFTGEYFVTEYVPITFQTYRDDNGAHLKILDDKDKTVKHVRLSDRTANDLGDALKKLANNWNGGDANA